MTTTSTMMMMNVSLSPSASSTLGSFAEVTCQVVDTKQLLCYDNVTFLELDEDHVGSPRFYVDLGVAIALLVVAGIISGLTVGVISLDPMHIEIMRKSGEPTVRSQAATVAPLVKRHHLLLVSLLLLNAGATEALPIFLDRLVGPIIAVVLSVSGVLIFGEIIPQAVCSRYGLAISARCAWLIWFLIAIVFPVSYPVSLLLDCILGHESTMYRRAEIKQFIGLHAEPSSRDGSVQGDASGSGAGNGTGGSEHTLTVDEANVIRAAIDLSSKTVADVMTPIDDVFMVDETTQLTRPVMEMLVQRGFSRVPVFRRDRSHVVGVMLMKQLILVSHEQGVPISSLPLRAMPIVPSTMDCYGALDMFQLGRSHIAMVVDRKDMLTLVGCVTLEDIIEELLNEEIADEAGAALAPRGSKDWGGTRSIDEPLLRASGNFNRTESVAGSYADPRAVPRLHLTESGSISDTSESIRHTIDAAHHSLHHASTTHTAATTAVPAGFARARSAAQTRFRRNLDERRPLLRASMHLEDPVGDVIRVVDSPNSNYNSINTNEQ